jgi:hypothetical protein
MGTEKRAEGLSQTSGQGFTSPSTIGLPTAWPSRSHQHSTAMLQLQVAGEGHNNKESAP